MYQADQQGSAVPIIPPDELRQDVASSMGTAVRVQDLSGISQKQVSHGIAGYVMLPHHLTPPGCREAALSHFIHVDDVACICLYHGQRKLADAVEAQLDIF